MFSNIALAATLVASATALPATLATRFADDYVGYTGDGSVGAGWPSAYSWGSYDQLWDSNVSLMEKSCGWNNWGADNLADEINGIKNAIQQESKGCVRVPTTNNGVVNPGLMQAHNGSGSCAGVNPCPSDQIVQMIRDGTAGTSSGAGLQQLLGQARGATRDNGSRAAYAASRLYNSGSANYSNLNNGLGSTPCYSSDVANRLTGWTLAPSQCRA